MTQVVAAVFPTSETGPAPARGAAAVAAALAPRLGGGVRTLGAPTQGRASAGFASDLEQARGALAELGTLAERAFAAAAPAKRPFVATAGQCSIAVATLAALARERPDARVLWLDAHGDFNTPATTQSGYLGGMPLAGGCGAWDTGFEGAVAPDQLVLAGVRDLDPGEEELLAATTADVLGVTSDLPARVRAALRDEPVFVHLDLDVLDPEVFPHVGYPVPRGLTVAALETTLRWVGESATVLGVEVTAFHAPEDAAELERLADRIAALVAPLLVGA